MVYVERVCEMVWSGVDSLEWCGVVRSGAEWL